MARRLARAVTWLVCADIRIASERAIFAESFVRVGIVAGDGGAWFAASRGWLFQSSGDGLHRRSVKRASRTYRRPRLQGRAPEELMKEAMALAERIAFNPPHVLRWTNG